MHVGLPEQALGSFLLGLGLTVEGNLLNYYNIVYMDPLCCTTRKYSCVVHTVYNFKKKCLTIVYMHDVYAVTLWSLHVGQQ